MNEAKMVQHLPPDGPHTEAYGEVAAQFERIVLEKFDHDARMVAIFRDLPMLLKINATLSGVLSGALIPMMALTDKENDPELARAIANAIPELVRHIRERHERVMLEAQQEGDQPWQSE